ncbi:MAG: DUF2188 domain-containing protein [Thermoanaerobaculia bacterium]
MGKNQHVVPHGDGWGVVGEGNQRSTGNYDTQQEAFERAREIAINQGSEVFIHRPNGQIRERNTYGDDPFPPKG